MIQRTVETVGFRSPPTITPTTHVREAAERLRRPDVPALVVVDDGTVVGMVTESDIVAMVAETSDRPDVRTVMSSPVTTISPTATLPEAAETMQRCGVRHLPVVDDGVHRGLLSTDTLAPYLSRHRLDIEWQNEPLRVEANEQTELTVGD